MLAGLALILAFVFARLAQRLRQPAVMMEIIAGLALGPSLLGLLPGRPADLLFPADTRPLLQALAQLGLVLFMFGVGYQFDVAQLRGSGRQVTVVSLSSVALPFVLGAGLAVIVVIATASAPWPLVRMVLESALFLLFLVYVVRPGLRRLLVPGRRRAAGSSLVHAILVTGLFLSAWATNATGLHAVFGAFAFGAAVPRDRVEGHAPEVAERIEQTSLFLLPVFFTVTGLSVDLRGLGERGVLMVVAVIVVACVGKFAGAASAARLSGVPGASRSRSASCSTPAD
ncbi:cation:proton antiporter [Streptomyces sp. NPDC044571]|uniref:cation:proton antiporter n=1 Tax=Streptomyces sp. NPDC044571 TaxID=3155371 RepID=UPI0033F6FEC1